MKFKGNLLLGAKNDRKKKLLYPLLLPSPRPRLKFEVEKPRPRDIKSQLKYLRPTFNYLHFFIPCLFFFNLHLCLMFFFPFYF